MSTLPRREQTVTEEHLLEMEEAFNVFDSEKTGSIDYHELKVAIRALGFSVRREEVQRLAAMVDRKQDGRIDFEGFRAIVTRKIEERDPNDEIESIFALLDTEGTGKIGVDELRTVAAELGEDIDESELQAMIQEFASDGQAVVTLREFKYIMKQCSSWD